MSEPKKIASLDGVVFNYPAGNNALDKITLDFHQGEIIGLVGANGAGKTTLMKLLAGYMDKSDGAILLGGRPIEEYSNKRLNEFVTLVEQNPENQLVGPTVEDELARACRLMGYEGRVIREKVDFVLKLVRMKQAKEWYLDEMSSGERRRVALALALVADPALLLLDEPLADLDMVGARDTIATIKELKSRGLCILVSSHRLEDILELTDRVAVLGEGRVLIVDEPQIVLSDAEALKLASITVPAIPRLFIRLQAEGFLPLGNFPVNFEDAVARFKEELDRRKRSVSPPSNGQPMPSVPASQVQVREAPSDKAEKSSAPASEAAAYVAAKAEKSGKAGKPEKGGKADIAGKNDKGGKAEKVEQTGKAEKSGGTGTSSATATDSLPSQVAEAQLDDEGDNGKKASIAAKLSL